MIEPFKGDDDRYHIIYKTTNKINGKSYIGKHTTDNYNDGYYGSGNAIKDAISKYGIHNFTKEIISFHKSSNDAFIEESKMVTEDFINDTSNYNLTLGGFGGVSKSEYHKHKLSEARRNSDFQPRANAVYVMDSETFKIIKEFVSIKEAKEFFECSHHIVVRSCRDNVLLNGMKVTRDINDKVKSITEEEYKAECVRNNQSMSDDARRRQLEGLRSNHKRIAMQNCKKINVYDINTGDLIETLDSVKDVVKQYGISRNILNTLLDGRRKTPHDKYTFEYNVITVK